MENNDFAEAMAKRNNKELIIIASLDKNDYQPLAVVAAEAEIKKRNITPTIIEQVTQKELEWREQEQKKLEKEQEQEKKGRKKSIKVQLTIWLICIVIGGIISLSEGDITTFVVFAFPIPLALKICFGWLLDIILEFFK